jgi:hypothetical protein
MKYYFTSQLNESTFSITCNSIKSFEPDRANLNLEPIGLHDIVKISFNDDFLKIMNQDLGNKSFEFKQTSDSKSRVEFKNVWNGDNLFLHGSWNNSILNNFICEVPNENSNERFHITNTDMLFWFTHDGINIIKLKHVLFILELTWNTGIR